VRLLRLDLGDPKLKGSLGELVAKHALAQAGYAVSSGREVADYIEAYLALKDFNLEHNAEVNLRGLYEVLLPQLCVGWVPRAKVYVGDVGVLISSAGLPGAVRVGKDLVGLEIVYYAYARAKELVESERPSALIARRVVELNDDVCKLADLVNDLRTVDLIGVKDGEVVAFEVKAGGSVSSAQISRAKKLRGFKIDVMLVEVEIPCRPLVRVSRGPFR